MTHSNFRDHDAWKQARKLVPLVYQLTDAFPRSEQYVLVQQMRKATHSVHLNLAEGSGRLSNGEWQQFLGQARGSVLELESAIICAFDLQYCTQEQAAAVTNQVKRVAQLINGTLRSTMQGYPKKKFAPDTGKG